MCKLPDHCTVSAIPKCYAVNHWSMEVLCMKRAIFNGMDKGPLIKNYYFILLSWNEFLKSTWVMQQYLSVLLYFTLMELKHVLVTQ